MANKNISISSSTKNLSLPSVNYGVGDVISLRPTEAGIYSFEIFGSSGSGTKAKASEVALNSSAGSGGGGGCYGYFKLKLGTFEQVGIAAQNFIDISFPNSGDATYDWEDIVLDGISVLSNIGSCNFKLTAFAGRNGNVKTGGYLSFANSGGDPDDNNNNLFVSYHSSSGGAGADLSNFDINNWKNTSLGGSGGKDSSGTNKGYQGGAGEIIIFGATTREAGAGQQGKIIINYIEPIEIEPETPPDSGGTTDPETPPSGTDPETPSQPSTTIPNILTKESIQELKTKINTELQRRCFYGNISPAGYEVDGTDKQLNFNQNDPAITDNINDNFIEPINLIFINENGIVQDGLSEIGKTPIDYSYINTIEDKLDSIGPTNYPASNVTGKDAAHGCKNLCTGFCSSTCGSGCRGQCGENCSKGCGATSGGTLSPGSPASCDSCGGSCSVKCGDCSSACSGNCGEGCGACGTTCSGDCTAGCSGSLTGGVNGSCESSCQGGAACGCGKNDCSSSCGSNDCNAGCSVKCGSSCTATCGGCGNTCGSSSATPATESGCNSCYGDCQGCGSECTGSCRKKCEGTCLNTCKDYCSASSKSS